MDKIQNRETDDGVKERKKTVETCGDRDNPSRWAEVTESM